MQFVISMGERKKICIHIFEHIAIENKIPGNDIFTSLAGGIKH